MRKIRIALQAQNQSAFTLIELLVVLGILGILAAIVITAVAPSRQLTAATDAWRRSAAREILNAITQYVIEEGSLPGGVPVGSSNALPICRQDHAGETSCVDLDILVTEDYITALPVDSAETNADLIGFTVYQAPQGFVTVEASHLGVTGQTGGATGTTGGDTTGTTGGGTTGGGGVMAGHWYAASLMESHDGIALYPVIVSDADGNVMAVWQRNNGGYDMHLYARRFTLGQGWSVPAIISSGTASPPTKDSVRVNPSGHVVVSWRDTFASRIYANTYVPGAGWSGPILLENSGSPSLSDPSVYIDASGNALATWSSAAGARYSRFAAGGAWSSAADLSPNLEYAHARMYAADGNERLYVGHASAGVYDDSTLRFTPAGDSGVVDAMNFASAGLSTGINLYRLSTGEMVALWSSGYNVFSRIYSGGLWGSAEQISSNYGGYFTAMVDGNDIVTAAWSNTDGVSQVSMSVARLTAGSWEVETINGFPGATPSLSADADGHVMLAWATNAGVLYAIRNEDNAWSDPYTVDSTTYQPYGIGLALAENGYGFVLLTGTPSSNMFVARYCVETCVCGDNTVNADAGETCDAGSEHATCDDDCTAVACGDGNLNEVAGETCDDGNLNGGDGCDNSCRIEQCGDGYISSAVETCDDGDSDNGDGCSSTCAPESGFNCSGEPSSCVAICGDGVILGSEACDDGDTDNGDGCNSTCTIESGYNCSGTPSSCSTTCGDSITAGTEECDDGNSDLSDACLNDCQNAECGDGQQWSNGGSEQCDDGNMDSGDGCNSSCQTEYCGDGIDNNGSAEECDSGGSDVPGCDSDCTTPVCGDGHTNISDGETCDDGNTSNGDSCAGSCRCGNGSVDSGEQCDDWNQNDGDGCDSDCQTE